MRIENKKKYWAAGLFFLGGVGVAFWFSTAPRNPFARPTDRDMGQLSLQKKADPLSTEEQSGSESEVDEIVSGFTTNLGGSPQTESIAGSDSAPNSAMEKGSQANSVPSSASPLEGKVPSKAPAAVLAPAVPSVAQQGCFSVEFAHKKMSSHSDGEACLQHKNLLVLQAPQAVDFSKINSTSICVRVNGEPVSYQKVPGRKDQLVIGTVAGPDSRIIASFCLGKSKCNEPCVVAKRDEFMSALGMDEDSNSDQPGWDGTKGLAKEDTELDAEVVAFNRERGGVAGATGSPAKGELFSGWMVEKTLASCPAQKLAHKLAQM